MQSDSVQDLQMRGTILALVVGLKKLVCRANKGLTFYINVSLDIKLKCFIFILTFTLNQAVKLCYLFNLKNFNQTQVHVSRFFVQSESFVWYHAAYF
jgi:hypothetical protein